MKIRYTMLCSMVLSFLGCDKPPVESVMKIQAAGFKAFIYKSKYSFSTPYRLFEPQNYDNKKSYPLVIYLSGSGGRGKDNVKQVDSGALFFADSSNQAQYPAFVFVPQCPNRKQWLNANFRGTPFTNYKQDEIPESESMKMVMEIIDTLMNKYPIDKDRLYVTGYSMGGSGTWDIITRYPDKFAAAITVNGVSDPSKAHLLTRIPIWAFHGKNDEISLVQNTRSMISEVKKYNTKCKYTEYPDGDHFILDRAYHEPGLFDWLFAQKK